MDNCIERKEKAPENENPGEITLKEFVELVGLMRHNQRRYFAMRKPEILATCKKLEKEVDSVIARFNDTQLKLF